MDSESFKNRLNQFILNVLKKRNPENEDPPNASLLFFLYYYALNNTYRTIQQTI